MHFLRRSGSKRKSYQVAPVSRFFFFLLYNFFTYVLSLTLHFFYILTKYFSYILNPTDYLFNVLSRLKFWLSGFDVDINMVGYFISGSGRIFFVVIFNYILLFYSINASLKVYDRKRWKRLTRSVDPA